MMPEIPEVARTVVSRAVAVGTGLGDAAERACPDRCCAQPLADTAAASSVASQNEILRIALTGLLLLRALVALLAHRVQLGVKLLALIRR